MPLKIAINGFGRIGRCAARIVMEREDMELTAVNDPADAKTLAYLAEHDSVHGLAPWPVRAENGSLFFGEHRAVLTHETRPESTGFSGADVVLECSGRFLTSEAVRCHLERGVKRVLFSAPAEDDTPTFVLGVNADDYAGERIVSNASCTTNCLAPIAGILDERYGIESGLMTTIHAYTGGQSLTDAPVSKDPRRCRAAAVSMVPTTTHAAAAVYKVLPQLRGRLHGRSVRVPTADVSLMDLNLVLRRETTAEEVNAVLKAASEGPLAGILGFDERFGVSQDFAGDSRSAVVAADLTQIIGGRHLKVMAWYDNEWGYANRLIEMAGHISEVI